MSPGPQETNMRVAIKQVEDCQQVIFTLISELEIQSTSSASALLTDASALQAILDDLTLLLPTIHSDVAFA